MSAAVSAHAGPPVTHLLYLHGFRSSPRSAKATLMAAWVAAHRPEVRWWCPQLPASPRTALDGLLAGVSAWPVERMAVVGSSLGGFYATVLAERLGCRAAVLNPAVDPARDLARHIGEQSTWHDPALKFEFTAAHVDELRAITPQEITNPRRYYALIAKGDEVLDWREMSRRYEGSAGKLLPGGDHALSDFETHMPDMLRFLTLAP